MNQNMIQKLNKKIKSIDNSDTCYKIIITELNNIKDTSTDRDLGFVMMYYGVESKSYTLEQIGELQNPKLTRERVRQVIQNTLNKFNKNIYNEIHSNFAQLCDSNVCIDADLLCKSTYFSEYHKNIKGLSAVLNDCGIKQVAYRKKIYFYSIDTPRTIVIKEIQKTNKEARRKKTLSNMSKKAKTVTYVPTETKTWLKEEAKKNKLNLNPFYENILSDFIDKKPYYGDNFEFSKTKSWKARKGRAEWSQVGIYINRELFNLMRKEIKEISSKNGKNVSLMGFISQAFVWKHK